MAAQLDVKHFLRSLTCPIGLDPLRQAVNLFPCCHKVNQVAAEKRHGKIVEGHCELKERCVVCNTEVVDYAPDDTIRDLAGSVFGHEKDLESLPTHPLVLEQKRAEIGISYPGPSAIFIWTGGEWDKPFDSGGDLCRLMHFMSITDNSLLEGFRLLGYYGGQISLAIDFKKDGSFKKFLKSHRMFCSINGSYRTETLQELKTLFRIIALNNEIPADQFNQIRQIVERGACDPLSEPSRSPFLGGIGW